MKVITISGKAQAGKDTTAKVIKDKLNSEGHSVLITHYADLLKYQAKTLFDWNGKKDDVGRSLLQHLGTDIVRKKNPDYWVDYVSDMLWMYGDRWDYVLIPDARFPNEINQMKEQFDCITIKVISDYDNGLTEEQKNHPSETALDDFSFDYTIVNNRTVLGLNTAIEDFIKKARLTQ